MKKYLSISYVFKRIFLLVSLGALLFSLFPESADGAKTNFTAVFIACAAIFAGLTIANRVIAKKCARRTDLSASNAARFTWTYIVLAFLTLAMLLPFYVIFVTSLKNSQEANLVGFTWWPKQGVFFTAYRDVWTSRTAATTLTNSLANTMKTALLPSVVTVFVSGLSAYSFAKLKFKGKELLFSILMFSMMAPACITLTTSYVVYDTLGWVNTFYPLIIPSLFGGASIVFFLRQYFMGIPNELLESGRIDGLGKLGIFFQILLPLSIPAYLAQFILTFVARYNDYLGPLLYLQRPKLYTLSIFLKVFSGTSSAQSEIVSAASVITILPLVIIYLIFQRKILSGIAMSSGLKV